MRTAAPGTTFTLTGHADIADESADNRFVMLRVVHLAHYNLSAELKSENEKFKKYICGPNVVCSTIFIRSTR